MPSPREALDAVRDFVDLGGSVLVPIMAATFVMWTLILERYWYFYLVHPRTARCAVAEWSERHDRSSWYARQIRALTVSLARQRLQRSVGAVKTLVSVCLLLGLLGTIIGMIEVFDSMAILGSGNPRAVASGVYKAMLPTMSGMVAALSGYYFGVRMERFARVETARLEDQLGGDDASKETA